MLDNQRIKKIGYITKITLKHAYLINIHHQLNSSFLEYKYKNYFHKYLRSKDYKCIKKEQKASLNLQHNRDKI